MSGGLLPTRLSSVAIAIMGPALVPCLVGPVVVLCGGQVEMLVALRRSWLEPQYRSAAYVDVLTPNLLYQVALFPSFPNVPAKRNRESWLDSFVGSPGGIMDKMLFRGRSMAGGLSRLETGRRRLGQCFFPFRSAKIRIVHDFNSNAIRVDQWTK